MAKVKKAPVQEVEEVEEVIDELEDLEIEEDATEGDEVAEELEEEEEAPKPKAKRAAPTGSTLASVQPIGTDEISAADIAAMCKVDPRSLRNFLRANYRNMDTEKGGRYHWKKGDPMIQKIIDHFKKAASEPKSPAAVAAAKPVAKVAPVAAKPVAAKPVVGKPLAKR